METAFTSRPLAIRLILALNLALTLLLLAAPPVRANSAEAPGVIVIVSNPPQDLKLYLKFEGSELPPIELDKNQVAWEAQYRFYYNMIGVDRPALDSAVLVAEFGGMTAEYPIQQALLGRYNNILTFNPRSGASPSGQTAARSVTLVSLRVGLTLLIEGLIFFLFGYRQRRSWLAFLIINLVTQGALNIALNQSFTGSYLILALLVFEILVLLVELIAFALAVREHGRLRVLGYVLLANIASLLLGGFLITNLPV